MMKLVVLCCAFAAASSQIAPYFSYVIPSPIAYSLPSLQPYNYRGPLSLAPGQPAEVLGADGRPLDTLEVNQDRAAHFAAKEGLHVLKKRSAAISIAAGPIGYPGQFAPAIAYTAPIGGGHFGYIAPFIGPVTQAAANILQKL